MKPDVLKQKSFRRSSSKCPGIGGGAMVIRNITMQGF